MVLIHIGVQYLNGGAAYHWYFDPNIREAEPYYNKCGT
jgi:hypothetical protein